MTTTPNTLIFVDLASDDPVKAGEFYHQVFGWQDDHRPTGVFHRFVPGGQFLNPDGSDSQIGNLHLGVFDAANARPHPDPAGVEPRRLADDGRKARIWVLVGEGQSEDAILATAEKLGARILWRNHYWKEFNGFNSAFRDPWGNEIILWVKGGADPRIPEGYTRE